MPITWDFSRQLDAAASPGNTTSYFDTMCQSFYVDTGQIKTQIAQLNNGQWQDIEPEDEIAISESGFSELDIEHHFNGTVAGSAQHDSDVVLLLYEYMIDVSTWLKDGTWRLQPDNSIKAGTIDLVNADKSRFEDNAYTLFGPGNRLRFLHRSGDSAVFEMGTIYIENSPFADYAESFRFSGRNAIGFYLASQTFDERTTYTGTRTEVFTQMLLDAGVPEPLIMVKTDATAASFEFEDEDSYFEGLTLATELIDWYFDDLPDGRIVIGDEAYIKSVVATTGIYSFSRGSEVVSRNVSRDSGNVYSRVCVRRKGDSPLSLYADVPYYDGWAIAAHRTFYQDVPDDTIQATMERIRDQLVEGMQYSGITETFLSPFRPWLQNGDVATITGDGARLVGIISDITHQFGRNGYWTQFTVTSGGTISNPDNPETVATKYIGSMGGANRKRRILDYLTGEKGDRGERGEQGVQGVQGETGPQGPPGEDGANGVGVPTGGTAGQLLVKTDGTDYNTEWADRSIWGGME